jgi:hypothetical protein
MKLCPRCGAPNHDQAINCHCCGIQFPQQQQQPSPAYWNQSPPNQSSSTWPTTNKYYFNQPRPAKSASKTSKKPKKNTVRKKKTHAWYIAAVAISWILYVIVFDPWNSDSANEQSAVKNATPVSQEQMIETMIAQMMLSWTPTATLTLEPSFTSTAEPTLTLEPSFTPTVEPTLTLTTIPTIPLQPTMAQIPALPLPAVPQPAAPLSPAPPPAAPPTVVENPAADCNPNYDPCVPNIGKVTCKSLGIKNIRVIGVDVYGLDRDKDGIACEKN